MEGTSLKSKKLIENSYQHISNSEIKVKAFNRKKELKIFWFKIQQI